MANAQLTLIETAPKWKLDPHTVEVGRAGIAKARAALTAAGPTCGTGPVESEFVFDLFTQQAA